MRCYKCQYENPLDYKFCGMCGATLEVPAIRAAETRPVSAERDASAARIPPAQRPVSNRDMFEPRRPEPPPPISGPSFLGLGNDLSSFTPESSRNAAYLLEDEKPTRSYGRFFLLLVILAVCVGLGWLEYGHSGSGWTLPWSKSTRQTTPPPSTQTAQATPAVTPASPQTSPTAIGEAPAAENKSAAKSAAPTPPVEESTSEPKAVKGAQSVPAIAKPSEAGTRKAAAKSSKSSKSVASSDDTDDEDTEEAQPAPAPKGAKPVRTPAKAATPIEAANPDDALVANAEKYLYGRGVAQNCDRATTSLKAAAGRQNVRARSLLGTMYATGHCVSRDLPSAYRWFALASRESADNVWVQRNLEMIWREMTPQERQLATQKSQ